MKRAPRKAPEGYLTTAEAAKRVGLQPQTLRNWACNGGPVSPYSINGPLFWKISDLDGVIQQKRLPKPPANRSRKAMFSEAAITDLIRSLDDYA